MSMCVWVMNPALLKVPCDQSVKFVCVFKSRRKKEKTHKSMRVGHGFHSRGNFLDLCGCGDPNNAENTEKWWGRQLLYGLLDLVY